MSLAHKMFCEWNRYNRFSIHAFTWCNGFSALGGLNPCFQYNTIQHNTTQYNTIQYNTIQYNTIQYNKNFLRHRYSTFVECQALSETSSQRRRLEWIYFCMSFVQRNSLKNTGITPTILQSNPITIYFHFIIL